MISKYLNWLQKDNPAGDVEKYPEINEPGQSSQKGVYIIGDLTGIPLLKFAAESGKKIIDHFNKDDEFLRLKENKHNEDIFDVVIVGGGPAGIAAAVEAKKAGLKYIVLEAGKLFNTIINFPKGKPIFAEPDEFTQESEIIINDGTKESLLDELEVQIKDHQLNITENVMVSSINKDGKYLDVKTNEVNYKAVRVVLAIGKSGNSRQLNVEGDDHGKVYNRMFDPADTKEHDVLVVGGGDSALEAAIAAAEYAKSVSISYRKASFSRPKEGNQEILNKLIGEGRVKVFFETEVKTITDNKVLLTDDKGEISELPNSMVFTLIGKELPTEFFRKSNIKMEGELSLTAKLQFLLLILVSGVIYFGKSSTYLYKHFFGKKLESFGEFAGAVFTTEFWGKFIMLPVYLYSLSAEGKIRIWTVTKYINAIIAYVCIIATVLLGAYLLYKFIKEHYKEFALNWNTFKYSYFIFIGMFFSIVFFGGRYFGFDLLGKSQGFWYTGLYSLTILLFGLRRIHVKPTKYIKLQTWSLILIQALPLFILPEFIFPFLGKAGLLGGSDGFVMSQVFPKESYWRSYGFILAWPLNFSNLYNGNITTFWLIFSLLQTFVFIPYIVYKWGKGAYCGWICSCGAMAETLGDEYRTKAPHGVKAKKWENIGQFILAAAIIITALKLISILYKIDIPLLNSSLSYTADFMHKFYYIIIDVIFAGVLGVGVYFFLSGRIWCRYGCPLAALMHVYARFTRYRIFSVKKKCISCNICTKVCHMGIDVMNYANKGIPMNDVECVRCSACVVNCPTEVLSFGSLPQSDSNNTYHKLHQIELPDKKNWKSGL